MSSKKAVLVAAVVVVGVMLLLSQAAAAAEITWNYAGQITYSDVPDEFPLGAPVRLSVTVDPEMQLLVRATATFDGFEFEMSEPRPIWGMGTIDGLYMYYSSGAATGPTVGSFTPGSSSLFFRSASAPPFTADPFLLAQSFVFEDGFGRAIGASNMVFELPLTPEDMLGDLAEQVSSLDVHEGILTSLEAKLHAALLALRDERIPNDVAARHALSAFIHAVEAQRHTQIGGDDAAALISAAEAIIGRLAD